MQEEAPEVHASDIGHDTLVTASMNRTILLFIGTASVALIEWLLFELLRTPYAPPRDMLTLLGQEKYLIAGFMWFSGVAWILISIWLLATLRLTIRQYYAFTAMIAFLLSLFVFILRNPFREVTPWDMMWMSSSIDEPVVAAKRQGDRAPMDT